jgi:hypothetical protein
VANAKKLENKLKKQMRKANETRQKLDDARAKSSKTASVPDGSVSDPTPS